MRHIHDAIMYRVLVVFLGVVGAVLFLDGSSLFSQSGVVQPSERVQKGAYLVTLSGCNDCHSPKVFTDKGPEPDPTRLLAGHPAGSPMPEIDFDRISPAGWVLLSNDLTAAVGPWGITYAANLTSDEETGIGRWTEEAFIATMRSGLHWGVGPAILPPMPWQNLGQASDDDLKAIFAYLKSTHPVHNPVPAPMSLEELKASRRK